MEAGDAVAAEAARLLDEGGLAGAALQPVMRAGQGEQIDPAAADHMVVPRPAGDGQVDQRLGRHGVAAAAELDRRGREMPVIGRAAARHGEGIDRIGQQAGGGDPVVQRIGADRRQPQRAWPWVVIAASPPVPSLAKDHSALSPRASTRLPDPAPTTSTVFQRPVPVKSACTVSKVASSQASPSARCGCEVQRAGIGPTAEVLDAGEILPVQRHRRGQHHAPPAGPWCRLRPGSSRPPACRPPPPGSAPPGRAAASRCHPPPPAPDAGSAVPRAARASSR